MLCYSSRGALTSTSLLSESSLLTALNFGSSQLCVLELSLGLTLELPGLALDLGSRNLRITLELCGLLSGYKERGSGGQHEGGGGSEGGRGREGKGRTTSA